MTLAVYSILTWLVIMTFTVLPKKLSFVVNSFVFFTMSIVIKNTFTVFGLNLNWIEGSEEPHMFLAYFLYRTFIYPIALLIIINLTLTKRKNIKKLTFAISLFIFIFFVKVLGEKMKIYTYVKWTHWHSIIEIVLFGFLTYISAIVIKKIEQRKSNYGNI